MLSKQLSKSLSKQLSKSLSYSGINYDDYYLYVDFRNKLSDQVSKTLLPAANYDTTHSNIVNGELVEYGTDEYVRDDDGRVLTCGGYTNELLYSSDLAQWTIQTTEGVSLDVLGEGVFRINFGNDYKGIYISTSTVFLSGENITGALYLKSETVNGVVSVVDSHGNATGFGEVFTVTTEWDRYFNYGVMSTDSVSGFWICKQHSGLDSVLVKFPQLTKGSYPLPYVPTNSTPVSVSATFSDDNAGDEYGPRLAFEDIPGAVDALDGVADGDEQFPEISQGNWENNQFDIISPESGTIEITENGFKSTGTESSGFCPYLSIINKLILGKYYECVIDVHDVDPTSGVRVLSQWTTVAVFFASGTYSFRFISNGTQIGIMRKNAIDNPYFTISSFSIKEITTASGEIEWKGRFGFNPSEGASAVSETLNIFTCKNEALHNISLRRNSGWPSAYFRADDGAGLADISHNWQSNISYTLILKYGPHPGYAEAIKMQLIATDGTTTWESSVVDFDGSFDPADFLFFGYKNPYPIWHESLKFRKEVTW